MCYLKTSCTILVLLAFSFNLASQEKNIAGGSVINQGTVVSESLSSTILRDNKVGLDTRRQIKVVLPAGYASSKKAYPVVYYLHSIYGKAEWIIGNGAKKLIERAVAKGLVNEFIFVIPDFSSPNIGSLYENSPVSGRWLDHFSQEIVPFIDSKYRTIRKSGARAVIGDFMGGRGALQLGMSHADTFGVVYALHPVALGVGTRPWTELGINWEKIFKAKTYADLGGDKPCETFVAICQAFLPHPGKTPFHCDYFMKQDSSGMTVDIEKMVKIQKAFMLEQRLGESAGNLRKLRGLAFDWARYDPNFDHVYAGRAFTRNLEDIGIEHEAEEYRGTPWNHTWDDEGRFYTRVLPFLNSHLEFE